MSSTSAMKNYFADRILEFEQISSHIYRLNIPWKFLSPLPNEIPVGVFLVEEEEDSSTLQVGSATISAAANGNINGTTFQQVEVSNGNGTTITNFGNGGSAEVVQTFVPAAKSLASSAGASNLKRAKRFLVDTAVPGQEMIIVTALCKLFGKESYLSSPATVGRILNEEIDAIFITHFHIDHSGGCTALVDMAKKALAGGHGGGKVPAIYMHKDELKLAHYEMKLSEQRSTNLLFNILTLPNVRNSPKITKGQYVCSALDGIMQEYAKPVSSEAGCTCNSLQFYHTPGHTIGHCCYVHRDDGIVLCGDAMSSMYNKLEQAPLAFTPLPGVMAKNTYEMVKALKECHTVVPSHHNVPKNKKGVYDRQELIGLPRERVLKFYAGTK